jgi:hypothetical protein|tara:strand:- start:2794 stop:2895 length:102 start_codon:yes stop_codon:yes gene_type:complete
MIEELIPAVGLENTFLITGININIIDNITLERD